MNATDVATLLPARRPKVKFEKGWWTVWYGSIRIRRYDTSAEAHRFATILATNRNTQQRRKTA
ncbi:hypothetical protein CH304_00385 [Rhodococcus sp. 15-649-1-2]|nr:MULTISPECIES: hypothetical protein [unclassified Rhodococcus (in: high G+C Gram-positive bacteria)]OZC62328.1 hypothetical protein CH267_01985 [Rhodococcus sp. 06-621-2]OZE88062.1 hypothetical protein CH304_00385 [Rhodococcus sp. 15-649-1-2]